jgi:alkylhydroperoxidase family enzyme
MPGPRIPYKTDTEAGPPELVQAIRERRGGALVELDRLLLYSPPVAEGWNLLFGRLRAQLQLPPLLRELAMCAVAVLNGAEYELFQHAPLYLQHGGTQGHLDALRGLAVAVGPVLDSPLFSATQRAALALVVQSTRQVAVDDAVFAAARAAIGDDRQFFELVAVTAAYNMVSRVLVAFDVQPDH